MTAEEAIDILDRCVIGDCELCANNERHCGHCKGSDYAFSAIAEAQKALEKRIPKKPIERYADYDNTEAGLCPFCNEGVDEEMNFCSYCGQAIDWEENE